MKNLNWALLCAMAALWACQKEPSNPTLLFDNYSNLATGNYWVYEQYLLDSSGVYTPRNQTDSNYVEKDTLIDGRSYFKLQVVVAGAPPNVYQAVFLRDSLHYLVDASGRILFSSQNTTDTLDARHFVVQLSHNPPTQDTVAYISGKMQPNDETVQVPAGAFVTKNFRETYQMWPKYSAGGPVRYLQHRYAKNVGLVEETMGFYVGDASGKYLVRRLKRHGKK
ncbi:MAG: hypothetical protein JNK89_03075 [Saprospiraceae bacterium]|nr:hypothetical protein [Saprospiraceae bacterium]